MARIRTVKPEYPKHRKVRKVSRDARLLAIHLWNLADDEGRLQNLPRWIIGEVFPDDEDVTPPVLTEWLDELEGVGLILRYEVDQEQYIACHDFTDHQSINKPRPSVLPAPPESRTAPVAVPDSSRGEGKGREQGKETPLSPNGDRVAAAKNGRGHPTPARQVFDAWVAATERDPARTRYSDERRRLIEKRLKDYPLDDLLAAVRGWKHSPHHRGENDRHRVYNDLDLLLRDSKRIEEFRDLEQRNGPAAKSGAFRRMPGQAA